MTHIILIGCGGVGSRFAEMLVRDNLKHRYFSQLSIIDDDIVEAKNLQRQMFFEKHLDKPKVDGLCEVLKSIDPKLIIYKYRAKILSAEHLKVIAQPEDLCVCCTDDVISKQVLTKYFERYVIAAVDRGIVEITVNNEYDKVWSFGTGYEVVQDVINNTVAAVLLMKCIRELVGGLTPKNIKFDIYELFSRI